MYAYCSYDISTIGFKGWKSDRKFKSLLLRAYSCHNRRSHFISPTFLTLLPHLIAPPYATSRGMGMGIDHIRYKSIAECGISYQYLFSTQDKGRLKIGVMTLFPPSRWGLGAISDLCCNHWHIFPLPPLLQNRYSRADVFQDTRKEAKLNTRWSISGTFFIPHALIAASWEKLL